jgi:hypothetical protein
MRHMVPGAALAAALASRFRRPPSDARAATSWPRARRVGRTARAGAKVIPASREGGPFARVAVRVPRSTSFEVRRPAADARARSPCRTGRSAIVGHYVGRRGRHRSPASTQGCRPRSMWRHSRPDAARRGRRSQARAFPSAPAAPCCVPDDPGIPHDDDRWAVMRVLRARSPPRGAKDLVAGDAGSERTAPVRRQGHERRWKGKPAGTSSPPTTA